MMRIKLHARRGQLGGGAGLSVNPASSPYSTASGAASSGIIRFPQTNNIAPGLLGPPIHQPPYPDGGPTYSPQANDCGCGCKGAGTCKPKAYKIVIPGGASAATVHKAIGQLGAAAYDSPCPQDDGTQDETHVIYQNGNWRCVNNPVAGTIPCPDNTLFTGENLVLSTDRTQVIGRSPICTPVAQLGPCPIGQLRTSHGECVCPPGQVQGDGRTTDPSVCSSPLAPAATTGFLDGTVSLFGHDIPKTYLLAGGVGISLLALFAMGGKR